MADEPTPPTPDPAAAPPAPAAPEPDPVEPPPAPGGDSGKGGKDAVLADLAKERDKRQALEQQLSDSQAAQQSQLDAIAKALGLKGDETVDPAALTAELVKERDEKSATQAELMRLKVSVEKAVPSHLVEFISGSTREEVEASITKVLEAFASTTPPGPKPDPSQGAGGTPASIDALIAEAEKAGNTREVIRLKARKGFATTN